MGSWEPGPSDFSQLVREQNPWRQTGSVPDFLAPPVERPLVAGVTRALLRNDLRRFQLIVGPRRVGKTTVMYQTVRRLLQMGVPVIRIFWLRLDHPFLLHPNLDLGALVRPVLADARVKGGEEVFLFLDELVYATNWALWLKTFYDDRWPLRVLGSSSAVGALRRQHAETGVGRWDERYLTPYLLNEYLELRGTPVGFGPTGHLAETLNLVSSLSTDTAALQTARRELMLTGGFPELLVALKEQPDETERLIRSQRVLRTDAVERAVYKDIPQSFGSVNPMQLERLLYVCAGSIAQVLSPSRMSRQLGISQPTLDSYLKYLERSFVIFTLPNYSGPEIAGQRRGRRLYFYDGAIRNAVLERGVGPLQDPVELGHLYENLAAAHLHCLSLLSRVRCYHWRDGDFEVDLIYDDHEFPVALEIATSSGHTTRGLQALMERHPKFRGRAWVIATDSPALLPASSPDGIGRLPLDLFLIATGAEFHRRLMADAG